MFNASKNSNDSEDEDEDELLVHMPDTSILFQRYLKSGRMINIYDWFKSFAVVLKAQKQHKKPSRKPSCNGNSSIPRTPCIPQMPLCYDCSNKKQQQNVDGDEEGEAPQNEERKEAEEELESWRLEVQAQFIHALHKLDYVRFVKHTGRKRDHVQCTVLDAPMSDDV